MQACHDARVVLCVWLILILLGLAACAAPAAEPADLTPEPLATISLPTDDYVVSSTADTAYISIFTDPSYTTAQRDEACTSDLLFDEEQAYARYTLPLLWTFQLNFDVTSDGEETGRPLGCLRLYLRNDTGGFDEIDSGGILVDTCGRSPFPSVELNLADGIATLDGNGYVACRMNLAAWTTRLAELDQFKLRDEGDLLRNFAPPPPMKKMYMNIQVSPLSPR